MLAEVNREPLEQMGGPLNQMGSVKIVQEFSDTFSQGELVPCSLLVSEVATVSVVCPRDSSTT